MFNFLKPKITVVTHNGSFHADEVFGCATLLLWAEKENKRIKIIRTRDPEIIAKADIVLDVGMTYDPSHNRFDHHQENGAGTRDNGIPYSSIGLIWKHFSHTLCTPEAAASIDRRLISAIDARDNGINIYEKIRPDLDEYCPRDMIVSFRPRVETPTRNFDTQFMKAATLAKSILTAEIENTEELMQEEKKVKEEIEKQHEPEILILDQHLFWDGIVATYSNIKMVISPKPQSSTWAAETPRDNLNDYNSNRLYFPAEWGGLREEAFRKVCGVDDAIFCHRNLFLVVAKSKEGALTLAKKALELAEANKSASL